MKSVLFLNCLGLLLSAASFSQPLVVDKSVAKALKKINPDDIKAHVQYLADDRLRGRMPGTEGYQLAVDYVVGKYTSLGVEPAGENGTYLQRVRLRRALPGRDASLISRNTRGGTDTLAYGTDFVVYPHPTAPQSAVEAPLVFAGFGISEPGLGFDDYAGLDAKGKIVVVVRGAPEKFPSTVAAHSQNTLTVLENAARHGAVGVVMGAAPSAARPGPAAELPNLDRGVYSVMGADGNVAVSRNYVSDQINLLAAIHADVLVRLFKDAGRELGPAVASAKGGTPASLDLGVTVRAAYQSSFQDFDSYNVVGRITGSDARLKEEYLVHSAHLDHVGVGKPVAGDSIYNGAHDNASGVASLLEIARVYSRLEEKPRRSVLLVMVTGEEMGLLGSGYFAKYPTVPARSIVADINTDMPTLIAPLLSAVALGAEHSTLKIPAANACQYLGIDLEADPEPGENRFVRSDQYSFVAQGIPALHVKYGNKTPSGENNLSRQVQSWRAKYYHQPQDGMDGVFDFEAGKTYVQLNFLIGYQVAQDPSRPVWNPGDFFGERFKSR
ncbi:MAG: M28 family peptidase [Ferruginibacter sp.]|nr:M28 family peptidase [Cytophagales bacterium]